MILFYKTNKQERNRIIKGDKPLVLLVKVTNKSGYPINESDKIIVETKIFFNNYDSFELVINNIKKDNPSLNIEVMNNNINHVTVETESNGEYEIAKEISINLSSTREFTGDAYDDKWFNVILIYAEKNDGKIYPIKIEQVNSMNIFNFRDIEKNKEKKEIL